MTSILSAESVTKRFGELVALDHVDLEVADKSIHAIIGPNGAGKTAFFNCVTGFYPVDDGFILFRDKPLVNIPPIKLPAGASHGPIKIFDSLPI